MVTLDSLKAELKKWKTNLQELPEKCRPGSQAFILTSQAFQKKIAMVEFQIATLGEGQLVKVEFQIGTKTQGSSILQGNQVYDVSLLFPETKIAYFVGISEADAKSIVLSKYPQARNVGVSMITTGLQ